MADSYKDITGPVTVVIIFKVKEGRAEQVAKDLSEALAENVRAANAGELPGYLGLDCTRYGNTFALWERYADADVCERMLPGNVTEFIRKEGTDLYEEAPTFLFFPTEGLGVPKYFA